MKRDNKRLCYQGVHGGRKSVLLLECIEQITVSAVREIILVVIEETSFHNVIDQGKKMMGTYSSLIYEWHSGGLYESTRSGGSQLWWSKMLEPRQFCRKPTTKIAIYSQRLVRFRPRDRSCKVEYNLPQARASPRKMWY